MGNKGKWIYSLKYHWNPKATLFRIGTILPKYDCNLPNVFRRALRLVEMTQLLSQRAVHVELQSSCESQQFFKHHINSLLFFSKVLYPGLIPDFVTAKSFLQLSFKLSFSFVVLKPSIRWGIHQDQSTANRNLHLFRIKEVFLNQRAQSI